jgi:hypothetical protein
VNKSAIKLCKLSQVRNISRLANHCSYVVMNSVSGSLPSSNKQMKSLTRQITCIPGPSAVLFLRPCDALCEFVICDSKSPNSLLQPTIDVAEHSTACAIILNDVTVYADLSSSQPGITDSSEAWAINRFCCCFSVLIVSLRGPTRAGPEFFFEMTRARGAPGIPKNGTLINGRRLLVRLRFEFV